jgi:hypothetical protein
MKKAEHRQQAVELFNLAWKLMEKKARSQEEDDAMLHAAHASRWHWGEAGTAVNLARGEWQCSRVYTVLGRAEPALHHAMRSLEICRKNAIGDFDLAYAHEALARASNAAKKRDAAKRYAAQAKAAGAKIREKEDRDWFLKDLSTL